MKASAGLAKLATTLAISVAVPLALSPPASAEPAPAIKASEANAVPQCVTPGRLMVLLETRNKSLDERYKGIATEYMRHGEPMGLRWDYAFYQMIVETGALTYTGDVEADQNNFAGLGATGKGAKGESFADISTGVKAHLQHLAMYAGEKVDDAVAERTRKVQEWGVLDKWHASFDGKAITFMDLARQWAPGSKGYGRDILAIGDEFMEGACKGDDPRPELVAEARGSIASPKKSKTVKTDGKDTEKGVGADVAANAIAEQRADAGAAKSALGSNAALGTTSDAAAPQAAGAVPGPAVKILNPDAAKSPDAEIMAVGKDAGKKTETAALTGSGAVAGASAADKAKGDKSASCRVWTASYGGAKAMIIKAKNGGTTNYTVLDVNEGAEKVEAQAYITAYAKGGESVGEFADQAKALDKAFELCPEG
ncbi:MAG: glucosaminidase domain-containing protein [Hyphomicrobium sp.]|nr:glucosaminidase domain-containing protein [Hyphomicrobium sp.]